MRMKFGLDRVSLPAAGVALVLATGSSAVAQDGVGAPWAFEGAIYLWGASIGGETISGEDIDISFGDLVENLQFAGMAAVAARRGPWTLFGDFIYLDVESNQNVIVPNMIGGITGLSTGVSLKSFITTFGPAYQVYEGDRTRLSALVGARYLWVDSDLNLSRGFGLGGVTFSGENSAWDGVVGLRGQTQLTDKWSISYYGDVGGGDSAFTGQALLTANYRYRKVDLSFGYRYLSWDLDDFGPIDTLSLSGPFAGVKFTF